jgi:hypothetical protein
MCVMICEIFAAWGCLPELGKDCMDMTNAMGYIIVISALTKLMQVN